MLEEKRTKKMGFRAKIGEPIDEIAQLAPLAQLVRELVNQLSLLGSGSVEECKFSSLSSSSYAFSVDERIFLIERELFRIEV